MAYRAEIQIGVKGADQLASLQKRVDALTKSIETVNKQAFFGNKTINSIKEINSTLQNAQANLNETRIRLDAAGKATGNYKKAILDYVDALELQNGAQALTNKLIKEEIDQRRAATIALRNQVAANIANSRSARRGTGFGTFSAGVENDIAVSKSIRRNNERKAKLEQLSAAANATAAQVKKLADREEEFTARTDEASRAASRQAAEFLRGIRIAKQVAALNAAAGPAQLLLAPAAPGAPAMGGGARRRITGPVERLGGARTADEAQATLRLAQANTTLAASVNKIDPQYNRFLPSSEMLNASTRGLQRLTTAQEAFDASVASGIRFQEKYNQELERRRRLGIGVPSTVIPGTTGRFGGVFPTEGPIDMRGGLGTSMLPSRQAAARKSFAGRVPGAVSGGVIGAAFPLLFGQTGGAALGGGIGGVLGGFLGPGGSFAGSLLGTLLGEVASKGQKVKELADDIGFTAEQTKQLEQAFSLAGQNSDKFIDSVQNIRGLGLSLEDQASAIQLVSRLTEDYGGKIDKVTNAFTGALESGKVTQATLNQLTSQGIPIQDALAKKYDVNKDKLLQMAKEGRISIQTLTDTLVELGNKGTNAAAKPKTGFDKFGEAVSKLGTALANLGSAIVKSLSPPLEWLAGKLGTIISLAAQGIQNIARMLGGGTQLENKAAAMASAQLVRENPQLRAQRFGGRVSRSVVAADGSLTPGAEVVLNAQQRQRLITLNQGAMQKLQNAPIQRIDTSGLGQLPPSTGKSASDKAAKDAAQEAARVAEVVRSRELGTLELQRQSVFSAAILNAELALDPIEVRRLEAGQELMKLGIDTASELEKEKNSAARLAIARESQAKKTLILQKAEEDVTRILKERERQVADTLIDLQYELDLKNATTEAARNELKIAYEMAKLRKQLPGMDLSAIEAQKRQLAAPVLGADLINQEIGKISDEMVKLTDVGTMAIGIADSIGSAFANSFKGIISGSMSAQEALASFFQSVADYFLDMAAQIIQKWIQMTILNQILQLFPTGASALSLGSANFGSTNFGSTNFGAFDGSSFDAAAFGGGFSFKAAGGPVSSGRPYIVGEQGPELFVPGRSGAIVPNNQLGASTNVVVNVDAKGTSVQGNDQTGNQLARAVAAAVQAELVKQRRPGGLLTV